MKNVWKALFVFLLISLVLVIKTDNKAVDCGACYCDSSWVDYNENGGVFRYGIIYNTKGLCTAKSICVDVLLPSGPGRFFSISESLIRTAECSKCPHGYGVYTSGNYFEEEVIAPVVFDD